MLIQNLNCECVHVCAIVIYCVKEQLVCVVSRVPDGPCQSKHSFVLHGHVRWDKCVKSACHSLVGNYQAAAVLEDLILLA